MGRLSLETRGKNVAMRHQNFSVKKILKHLEEEGVAISKVALLDKYNRHIIHDIKRRAKPQILREDQYRFIDNTIADNTDMTSRQLHSALISKYPELHNNISISTVKRARFRLGWVSKTRYCALISDVNKEKRTQFCKQLIEDGDMEFEDVICDHPRENRP